MGWVCQKGGRTETDRTYPVSLTIITTITVVVVVMIYKQHECIDEERLYGLGLPLYGSAKKGDGQKTDRRYPVSLTIITTVVVMIYKQHECIDEERLCGLGLPLYGSAKKGDGRILVQKGNRVY